MENYRKNTQNKPQKPYCFCKNKRNFLKYKKFPKIIGKIKNNLSYLFYTDKKYFKNCEI